MHVRDETASEQKSEQAYKFYIRCGEVTRATVTIHAKDIHAASHWLHILFPGSDPSSMDVQHVGHVTDR